MSQAESPCRLALLVTAAPGTDAARHALRFADAALAAGHRLERVFFYRDGVGHANVLRTPPQDEINELPGWQALAREHGTELIVCIAAALRRGVLDADEAARQEKPSQNLAEGFTLSGLGQLAEATLLADRVISFGG